MEIENIGPLDHVAENHVAEELILKSVRLETALPEKRIKVTVVDSDGIGT
jgi:hypothetical protein